MKIAVPKEVAPNERRVALIPEAVAKLTQMQHQVLVQAGAGQAARFSDDLYANAGASLVKDVQDLYQQADIVLKVQRPMEHPDLGKHEADLLRPGSILIGFLEPLSHPDTIQKLAQRNITAFSMENIPRIARAQRMDALSSMSSIAGYKAALIAASSLGKFFPMMMTAAGTIPPAKVLVLGAGVAGLQAIATARRLGAVVEAYDVRPVVKEQVESLGAKFVELPPLEEKVEVAGGYARELSEEAQRRQRELIHAHVKESDVVITTALVVGRKAPLLVTEAMVKDMRPGSVIVDLASEAGGNCELTRAGETIEKYGVIIHGPLNLPSSMPVHASQMYSRNISSLLLLLLKDNQVNLDFQDQIINDCCITHQGQVRHAPTQALLQQGATKDSSQAERKG